MRQISDPGVHVLVFYVGTVGQDIPVKAQFPDIIRDKSPWPPAGDKTQMAPLPGLGDGRLHPVRNMPKPGAENRPVNIKKDDLSVHTLFIPSNAPRLPPLLPSS